MLREVLWAGSVLAIAVRSTSADVMSFESMTPLAAWHAEGLWNMAGLGSFNGQPVSETNQPSPEQRRLACDLELYPVPDQPLRAFLRVTNVVSTQGLSFFGTDGFIGSMSLTAIQCRLQTDLGESILVSSATAPHSNVGQVLQHGPCSDSTTTPMTETLGWTGVIEGDEFQLRCAVFPAYSMANWGSYCGGSSRIRGGGVFLLETSQAVLGRIDACSCAVHAVFGHAAQVFLAEAVECGCPSDFNGDGSTSAADLVYLFNAWGSVGAGTQEDLDGDGEVGPSDFAELLSAWGACGG